MIIVPLGHERSIARRWPWVTTAILLLNVVVFMALLGPDRRAEQELRARLFQTLEYYSEHPGLEPPPDATGLQLGFSSPPARCNASAEVPMRYQLPKRLAITQWE